MQVFICKSLLDHDRSKSVGSIREWWRGQFFKSLAKEGVIVYSCKSWHPGWGVARWRGQYPGSMPPPSGYSEAWFSNLEFQCEFPGGSPSNTSLFFVYQLPGTDQINYFSLDGDFDSVAQKHVSDQISKMNFTMADRLVYFLDFPKFTETLSVFEAWSYEFTLNPCLKQLCQPPEWQPICLDLFD